MQKQSRILPPQEILQHLLRLPSTSLYIHRLQDGHYILQQELGIVGAPIRGACCAAATAAVIWREEFEDLQLAPDPFARAGYKLVVVGEEVRG